MPIYNNLERVFTVKTILNKRFQLTFPVYRVQKTKVLPSSAGY